MSLRLSKRPGSPFWQVSGTVRGQSIRESTGTDDYAAAEGYRIKREGELWQAAVHGTHVTATFATAAESYLAAEPRSLATKRHVRALLLHFRNMPLRQIDQEQLDRAYREILTLKAGPAGRIRAVLTPLRAILSHAAVRRWCDVPAFETPKVPKPRTGFLLPSQATALIHAAPSHLRPLLVFSIGCGTRLSEALELDWRHVDLAAARARVWQKQDTERHIDLPPCVVAALAALPHREGVVFRAPHGGRYRDTGRESGGQIKTAWGHACEAAGLPGEHREWVRHDRPHLRHRRFMPEATPHIMRHTWATWHYCRFKDLLRLRHDGGWQTTSQCERYAKLMGDHYKPEIEAWLTGRPEVARESA